MNPITTATRDITAFKTLTMNRDHNLGDLVLGENDGLKCVNHHWLWTRANNRTITPEENNRIRRAFADALQAEYGARLLALATAQAGNGRCAQILMKINSQQFGQNGETGLSRATVKATIDEIEAVLARAGNQVNTVPRQIQTRMAGLPLQDLLGADLGPLLGLQPGEVPDQGLLRGVKTVIAEQLKTDAVKGAVDEKDKVSNPPARKAAIEGNCRFFAAILLKFLQGFPDLREEWKSSDASDAKWNFCQFVRKLDQKFCGGVWTSQFQGDSDREVGAHSRALVEIARTVFKHKLTALKDKVNELEPEEQAQKREDVRSYMGFFSEIRPNKRANRNGGAMFDDLTFEDVFAKGDTGEFFKYDVDRLKKFFSLCEAFDVDINARYKTGRQEVRA